MVISATHATTAHKLATVPELLRIACRFLGPSGCAKVASVSHGFFDAAAPVVWENVEGAHNLLALIPGSETTYSAPSTDDSRSVIRVVLPPNPDFSRFDTYAPFIKSLEIYGGNCFGFQDWKALHFHAKPLLPKLLSLTIRFGRGRISGYDDQLMWITTFLSPTLRAICVQPTTITKNNIRIPYLPPLLATLSLKEAISQCSHLEVLSFFPDCDDDDDDEGEEGGSLSAFLSLSESPLHTHLAQAEQLRELTSNEYLFKPDVLIALSSLPHLAHLKIYADQVDLPAKSIPLPNGSFLALRQLTLHLGTPDGVEGLWELGFLGLLTSLTIEFKDQHDDGNDTRSTWARSLLSVIADNSPDIRHLNVNFSTCDACSEEPCNLGDHGLLDDLAMLPLETVTLTSAWFGPYDGALYSRIGEAFAGVIDLHMPNQTATLQALSHFSKLPVLEHLVLDLELRDTDIPCSAEWTFSGGVCMRALESSSSSTTPSGDLAAIAK